MAGSITGIADTFGLPNYVGELFGLTPEDTPLLSAIGGLTGGAQTNAVEFEWQSFDLRDPSKRDRLEGATAPPAESRVRGNVRNVCQIFHEKCSVSYTKQAATGQIATPTSAPFRGVPGSNPVTSELDFQVEKAIKTTALDVNYAFWNSQFANPTNNASARRTRGLMQAIATNRISKATSTITGLSSATDTITETATALANDNKIVFTSVGDMTNVVAGRAYFVVQKATNTFKVSRTQGGAPLTLGTSTANVDYLVPRTTDLATTDVDDLLQLAYDNGGISEQKTATIAVNSQQKRQISRAYAEAGIKITYVDSSRSVGGVAVDTVVTDFGRLNIMLDRHVPRDAIAVLSMEMLRPVLLSVPGKGVFFEEPLAKTGSSDEVQIYGEIGLEYGNELGHALIRGLKV